MRSVRTQPDKFKTRRRTRAHFSAFAAALAVLALLGGCAQVPVHGRSGTVPEQPLARLDLPVGSANGRAVALVIAAEFALQNNHVDKAAADYAEAARISNDPAVAKRAMQLAQQYRIEAVPTVIVDGKFMTSSDRVGTHANLPAAIDELVAKARSERKS